MEIVVDGLISTQKKTKVPMEKYYPYSTRWKKIILVIIHIYGAIAIFILFCVQQDTEYES